MMNPKESAAMHATALALADSPSFLEGFMKDLDRETELKVRDVDKIVIELTKWKRIELEYRHGKLKEVSVYLSGKLSLSQKV